MISIEQWRARIGTFNCKRGYSGFLSSLFSSSSYYYYQPRKRRNASRELSSTADTSLLANSLSPDHEEQSATLLQANTERSFPTVTNVTTISSSSSSFSSGGLLSLRSSHLREVFVILLMVLLIAIIFQQLIVSGDIETNPGPNYEDKPDLSDLQCMSYTGEDGEDVPFRLMDQVRPHWRELAIALKFPQHEIAIMEHKDNSVYYLLTEWLRGANQEKDPRPVTWETLITALRAANIQEEAKFLEKHLDNSAHVAEQSQQDQDNSDGGGSSPAKKPRLSPQPNNTGTEKAETQPAIGNQPNVIRDTIPTFSDIFGHVANVIKTQESLTRKCQKKQQLQPIQINMVNYFQELMEDLQQETEYPPIPQHDPGVEPLEQFKAYLKHVYQQPRSPHRCFEKPGSEYPYQPFDLKLVETERGSEWNLHPYDNKENKEVILLRLHNNVDLINNCMVAVDTTNISKCTELYSPDCILVDGPPGVGKSAFAWELLRKWAKGEVLNNWSLVILIQLEDKTVREAKSLQDFIYHPDSTVRKEVCHYLKKTKGSGKTLFILDGYDRLSDEQKMNASMLQKLVTKKLPKATLMILSRAALSHHHRKFPFDSKIDHGQHFDISVFTDENIDKHIDSACSDYPRLATALKSYLSSHPFIHSLMYIPLQCAMVTDLYRIHWKCGDRKFAPSTLTELYTDLVRTLLVRYLSTHPEYSPSDDWVVDEFTDLQSLPGEVYRKFEVLAKLAALGIEKKVYVFDDSNLPGESLDLENSLGLMYQVEEVYPGRGRSMSYRFLHLTLQEYLAAYHCSLDPTNRLEEVAGSFDSFLSNYHSTSVGTCDHWAVWLFTAGLTKLSWNSQLFPQKLLENPQISSIAVTPMLHLLYEAQSPSLVLENLSSYTFSSEGSIEFKLFDMVKNSPLDCFVAGYCIPHSSRLWHLKTDSSCTDKHFDLLSKGLNMSSCRGGSGRIEKLEVHASKVAMLHLLHPHTKTLAELIIYAGYVDGTEKSAEPQMYNQFPLWYPLLTVLKIVIVSLLDVLPLFEVLPKMCSGSLEKLQLDFSSLSTQGHYGCVQSLGISSTSEKDKDTIFKQLKECPVKQLEIKSQLGGHTFPSLAISCKVESLQLTELTLTPALAECVGIEHNALHTLVLHSCKIPDDAGTTLTHSLQSPHCVLETIELDRKHDSQYSKIPDSVVEAIASCRTLKRCSMINFNGSSIIQHFVAGLKKNESQVLEELTMRCNSYGQPGHITELIRVANEWSSITKMQLSCFLEDFVRRLDINFRGDLIIEYISVNCNH